jgi:hypothetical protein
MRSTRRLVVLFALSALSALFALVPTAASAQQTAARALSAMTPLEVQVACGPPPSLDVPSGALRIVGSQDTVGRFVFGATELLVLDGGAARGVQLGQQYVVRRSIVAGEDRSHPSAVQTGGWLSIVAVNDKTAIAKVDHICDAITTGDYLEPFTTPVLPDGADRDNPAGELDFSTLGRILTGPENTNSASGGRLMLIDPGKNTSLQPGARFAIYRDLHTEGLPLSSVGEGVVLSVGKTMALTKITRSRDAIVTGDYVVPRK